MNEQIKKLAEQADAYARAEYEKWNPTPDFSGVPNIRNIFNAKFSELIVQECARFMETNTKVNDDGEVVDAPHAWQMIDHFGTKCLTFTFRVEE